jgi:hypothetical protein
MGTEQVRFPMMGNTQRASASHADHRVGGQVGDHLTFSVNRLYFNHTLKENNMSKHVSKVRKANARKALTKEINALRKMEAAFGKAILAINDNSENLSPDTYTQMVQVFNQLNIAVTVADSAVQDKAHKLAQTFVK